MEVCGGNSGDGKVLTKALVGGTVWGKPGPALLIPKLGPVERGHEVQARSWNAGWRTVLPRSLQDGDME